MKKLMFSFGWVVSFCSKVDRKKWATYWRQSLYQKKNLITYILNNKTDLIDIYCAYYRYHKDYFENFDELQSLLCRLTFLINLDS